ncbi:MAG: hypothetical protein ACYTG0_29405, partial [Planctomycetota bacterium]
MKVTSHPFPSPNPVAVLIAICLVALFGEQMQAGEGAPPAGGAIVNQAADGMFGLYRDAPFGSGYIDGSRSKEELVKAFQELVDPYADAQVAYVFLNVCYQRAAYPSKVWDSY